MKTAVIAGLASTMFLGAVVPSDAADLKRMNDLGTCLAFSYVVNGLDGKVDVPADLLPGILALKDEFMFEASIHGLDDDTAQTYVVEQLIEQNRVRELKGIDEVREKYLELCSGIAESLADGAPSAQ